MNINAFGLIFFFFEGKRKSLCSLACTEITNRFFKHSTSLHTFDIQKNTHKILCARPYLCSYRPNWVPVPLEGAEAFPFSRGDEDPHRRAEAGLCAGCSPCLCVCPGTAAQGCSGYLQTTGKLQSKGLYHIISPKWS